MAAHFVADNTKLLDARAYRKNWLFHGSSPEKCFAKEVSETRCTPLQVGFGET
jgi:hypothetical protein